MLVPAPAPAHHTAPHALPDGGVPLTPGAALFRGSSTDRVEVRTPRGPVLLRPVSPLDASAIDRFVRRLSAATRFRRFHSGLHTLTPAQLAGLVDVDHHERETVVACADGAVVGLAQYVTQAHPIGSVDVAVVVADEWQGLGLGRRLLTDLAAAARTTGRTQATVLVQGDNAPALHLLQELGANAQVQRAGATVEALISLA